MQPERFPAVIFCGNTETEEILFYGSAHMLKEGTNTVFEYQKPIKLSANHRFVFGKKAKFNL